MDIQAERGELAFELWVAGEAAGTGSKTPMPKGRMVGGRFRAVFDKSGRPVFYVKPSSEKTAPWMKKVREAAEVAWGGREPLDGALWLDVAFYEHRPASHYFHRKDGDVLRPDAPAFPHNTKSHDIDKMRRAISDPLTNAGVLADDKRIVTGTPWKLFADEHPHKAGAVIRVGYMRHQTVEEAGIVTPAPSGQASLDAAAEEIEAFHETEAA